VDCTETDQAVAGVARERDGFVAGDQIDRYRIVSLLGSGGMGHVYRARDLDLCRDVALKVLRRQAPGLEKRLFREAQAMARLDHPNIATVFDVGFCGETLFVARELVEGIPLGRWMVEPGRTLPEIVDAFLAAGRGLAAAHAAGVIHRDIKPDNVIVEADGNVEVVDFGLARGAGEPVDGVGGDPSDLLTGPLTVTGAVMGTPAYMAPEQHAGGAADARSDQFSFAVALWEAIYGVRPFAGATHAEVADATFTGTIVAPPAGKAPPALEAALRRALAADPATRHPDLCALLDAIEHATRPAPRVYRAHWPLAIALAVLLWALLTR